MSLSALCLGQEGKEQGIHSNYDSAIAFEDAILAQSVLKVLQSRIANVYC